jgi:transcriptional regulator with XRE-family HTH domain
MARMKTKALPQPVNAEKKPRRITVVDNRPLALRIGARLRAARIRVGLTQAQLAGDRYTSAYISALELGHAKPSMAALQFISERLSVSVSSILDSDPKGWTRLEADIQLAAGEWQAALDGYSQLAGGTIAVDRAEILRGTAEALVRLGQASDAVAVATEAAQLFERLRRPSDAALATYWLAFAHYREENLAEARALLVPLLASVRSGTIQPRELEFRILTALGAVEYSEGAYHRALAYLEEAAARGHDLDARSRGSDLFSQAVSYQASGDFEASIRTGLQSMALLTQAHAEREVASLKNTMALTYLKMGQVGRAAELAGDAHADALRGRDEQLRAYVYETQAEIALVEGDHDRALELAGLAAKQAGERGAPTAAASARLVEARVHQARQDFGAADVAFSDAASIARSNGLRSQLRDVLTLWGEHLVERGDQQGAIERMREALAL